jgi:hypothetical protein
MGILCQPAQMGPKGHIHYPGAVHHAMLRGNSRDDMQLDASDRIRFSRLRVQMKVVAYKKENVPCTFLAEASRTSYFLD